MIQTDLIEKCQTKKYQRIDEVRIYTFNRWYCRVQLWNYIYANLNEFPCLHFPLGLSKISCMSVCMLNLLKCAYVWTYEMEKN